MSDAPEEEVPKPAKTARKRPAKRATKTAPAAPAAETVVTLSAPEPLNPPPAPAPVEKVAAPRREVVERRDDAESEERPERTERSNSQRSSADFSDHGDPVATFGEPPSADSQGGGSKKRRRRKKNKHGQSQQGGGGGSQQVFQTAPTQGYAVSSPAPVQEYREREAAPVVEGGSGPAPAMHAAPRPKIDSDEVARKAWKIFLAEVSEEGLALIGDNDARELSRRSFRLAEVFVEEASRRQHR